MSTHIPESQPPEHDMSTQEREYERSGLYPENGKAFRIWALLAWLAGVVAFLAGASAVLNWWLLD